MGLREARWEASASTAAMQPDWGGWRGGREPLKVSLGTTEITWPCLLPVSVMRPEHCK